MRKLSRAVKSCTEWFYGKHRSDKDIGIKPTPSSYEGATHKGLPIIHALSGNTNLPDLEVGNAIYYKNVSISCDGYGASGVIRKMIITDIQTTTIGVEVDSHSQTATITKRVTWGLTSLTKNDKLGDRIEGLRNGNKPTEIIKESFDLSQDHRIAFKDAVKNTHTKHKPGVVYMDNRHLKYQELEDKCREDIYARQTEDSK